VVVGWGRPWPSRWILDFAHDLRARDVKSVRECGSIVSLFRRVTVRASIPAVLRAEDGIAVIHGA